MAVQIDGMPFLPTDAGCSCQAALKPGCMAAALRACWHTRQAEVAREAAVTVTTTWPQGMWLSHAEAVKIA